MKNGLIILPYFLIVMLFLIIASLILEMYENFYSFLPTWFMENLFLGLFTLLGAALGAFLAGQYTLSAVKEQIVFSRDKEIEEKERQSNTILKFYNIAIGEVAIAGDVLLMSYENTGNYYELELLKSRLKQLDLLIYDYDLLSKVEESKLDEIIGLRISIHNMIEAIEAILNNKRSDETISKLSSYSMIEFHMKKFHEIYSSTKAK